MKTGTPGEILTRRNHEAELAVAVVACSDLQSKLDETLAHVSYLERVHADAIQTLQSVINSMKAVQ